ncbi:DUF2281 domain-containing protein [Gloeocapsa sp. PCC 73106]|uniref:DUF2281 domain-containing protein n=1 Tax=Gloeocapsa sp. PCC 73106 TaxID=102232 RepID=UPI0002ACC584|nr:DUF2281 domain-containing protein [Gloeocapsa sp. PCC 73106]ELR98135.1 Protein of unknown function (DUF2281) [Gloeocapsa sp. PCC 73106]
MDQRRLSRYNQISVTLTQIMGGAIAQYPVSQLSKSMTIKELILQEIENIPETLLQEVLDFIQFLQVKHQPEMLETMLLSESSMQKDWLKTEEEEAWQDL